MDGCLVPPSIWLAYGTLMPVAALNDVGVNASVMAGCLHTAKIIARGKVCTGSKDLPPAAWQNHAMSHKNFIKAWREHRGLTLQALGDKLEPPASAGTMSAYESGSRNVSMDRLTQIADALGTTPGRLLDGPPEGSVTAEVIQIWDRIADEDREQAKRVLKAFAQGG
jgi:transcriptional regulator with XRE-family HTH domain